MKERLDAIRKGLRRLAKGDERLEAFGAAKHRYQMNPRATEEQLTAFERAHGVELPADYRLYLQEIANGGAGPYYGLYSLEEGAEAAKEFASKEAAPVEKPFPMDNKAAAEFLAHRAACIEEGDDDEIVYPEVPEPCTGMIYLSEYGCGWSYALVVKGEQAGKVWFIGENLSPVLDGDRQLGFLEWLEGWLEDALGEKEPAPPVDRAILNYDGHKHTVLPRDVMNSPRLKKLVLSRTALKEFPKEIVALKELRTLDLSMTLIASLPSEIGELGELRKLRFNYNHWTTLPDALADLKKLEELSIYYSYDVAELPPVIGRLRNLKRLRASYCSKLSRLPESLGALDRLELLDLNDTALETLPESFGGLTSLQHLKLAHTRLATLPPTIGSLRALRWLDIGIDTLDVEQAVSVLRNLPELRSLTLPLQEHYPASLKELTRVRKLTLTQNYTLYRGGKQQLAVPEEVGLLAGLEELDLTNNNQANALPQSIGDLTQLRRLELRSTAIRDVPESMRRLKHVQLVTGLLSRAATGPFGFSAKAKAKLVRWFPSAQIQIW
jgi:Leucine-rich repeat (LRR) protein